MKIESLIVPVKGIGRRDYSQVIEFASQATAKGHQIRTNYAAVFNGLATPAFPNAYGLIVTFDGVPVASDKPFHIYQFIVTSERKALVTAGLYQFASLADAYIWNLEKWHGDAFGYGEAKLFYSNGIKTEEGKAYVIGFSEFSEQPTFDIHLLLTMLQETVVYG